MEDARRIGRRGCARVASRLVIHGGSTDSRLSDHRLIGCPVIKTKLGDRRDVTETDSDVLPSLEHDKISDLIDVELGVIKDKEFS